MKMVTPLRWALLAVLLSGLGLAQAQVDRAVAQALLKKSDQWHYQPALIEDLQRSAVQQFKQHGTEPTEPQTARFTAVVAEVYAVRRVQEAYVGLLAQRLDAQHAPVLQRWFDSPLGRKVLVAETMGNRDIDVFRKEASAVWAKAPSERKDVIAQLVQAKRVPELMTEVTIHSSLVAIYGDIKMLDSPRESAEEFLPEVVKAMRSQAVPEFFRVMPTAFGKIYARLSTAELQSYLDFAQSAAGEHYYSVSLQAWNAALVEATEQIGRELAQKP